MLGYIMLSQVLRYNDAECSLFQHQTGILEETRIRAFSSPSSTQKDDKKAPKWI